MRDRYKIFENDYPYFITSTIIEWLPIFTKSTYFEIIIESLKFCMGNKALKLHA